MGQALVDIPRWVVRLIRSADWGDGGDGGGDSGDSGAGATGADAGSSGPGTGDAGADAGGLGTTDSSGTSFGGVSSMDSSSPGSAFGAGSSADMAEANASAPFGSGATDLSGGTPGVSNSTGAVAGATGAAATGVGTGAGGFGDTAGFGGFGGTGASAPSGTGFGDTESETASLGQTGAAATGEGLGFSTGGGPAAGNADDSAQSAGFNNAGEQASFNEGMNPGGVAPTGGTGGMDQGAFAGTTPGDSLTGSNPGFGFGPGDTDFSGPGPTAGTAPTGAGSSGAGTGTDSTGSGFTSAVAGSPTAEQAVEAVSQVGTGANFNAGGVLSDTGAGQPTGDGFDFGSGETGGDVLSPGGGVASILSPGGASAALAGSSGGIQEADGSVIPAGTGVADGSMLLGSADGSVAGNLSPDQVQMQNDLLGQWITFLEGQGITDPQSSPIWQEVLQIVGQQVGASPGQGFGIAGQGSLGTFPAAFIGGGNPDGAGATGTGTVTIPGVRVE